MPRAPTCVPIRLLIDNVKRLADYGWTFELQVFSGQMAGAAALAEACPQVTFVLQHAGMLEDLSPAGREAWRSGLRQLAARPNVVTKLSGFGTFIHRNDPDHIAWIVAQSVALFGAQRCLFGSNFPIEKLWTGYEDLLDAHLQASAALTPAQRSQHLRRLQRGASTASGTDEAGQDRQAYLRTTEPNRTHCLPLKRMSCICFTGS